MDLLILGERFSAPRRGEVTDNFDWFDSKVVELSRNVVRDVDYLRTEKKRTLDLVVKEGVR